MDPVLAPTCDECRGVVASSTLRRFEKEGQPLETFHACESCVNRLAVAKTRNLIDHGLLRALAEKRGAGLWRSGEDLYLFRRKAGAA